MQGPNQAESMNLSKKATAKKRGKAEEPEFPVKPVTIQTIKTRRGTMNHSYRDFSQVPPQKGYQHPTEIKDMTFSQKVHHILSNPDYEKWVSWMPHGRSFKVHVPVMFESHVCPKYFHHKRYSSFLRELNNHGFKHISKGADRNSYYHEFMLRDRPHLCVHMPRRKDARRLVADPDHEPRFYQISQRFPLDGSAAVHGNGADVVVARDESPSTPTAPPPPSAAPVMNHFSLPCSFPVDPTTAAAAPATVVTPHTVAGGGLEGIQDTRVLLAILEAKQTREREQQRRAVMTAKLLQNRNAAHLAAALGMFPNNNNNTSVGM